MSTHTAIVQWTRDDARFSDNRYSRAHTWRFDGGVTVAASASPHVVPLPLSVEAAVDPEEAFVAALSSCHMLWFLSIAAKAGFVVDRYADHAEGTMGVNAHGKQAVVTVTLRPRVTFGGARRPSREEHLALHEAAHAECFIANSVTTAVRVEPSDAASPGPEEAMGPRHLTADELRAGLEELRRSPTSRGRLEMIVRRPSVGSREVLANGQLDLVEGLVGDSWARRGSTRTADRTRHPDMQLNVMNARAIALIAQDRTRWPLAGDQLFVDLDLSVANVPPGTQLEIGEAIIEITAEPHTGCGKFVERFGVHAMKFVNSPEGRELNLRGVNARVVQPGRIREGDAVVVRPLRRR